MNTIPTSSIISGNQIQTDSITTNLTVACDPHLLVPTLSNGVPNPVFDKKKDGKSAIAVDICCLETPCDGQSGGGGGLYAATISAPLTVVNAAAAVPLLMTDGGVNNWDPATGIFTAPSTGIYLLNASYQWSGINPITDQIYRKAFVEKNGTTVQEVTMGVDADFPQASVNQFNWVGVLNQDDKVKILASQENNQNIVQQIGVGNVGQSTRTYANFAFLG